MRKSCSHTPRTSKRVIRIFFHRHVFSSLNFWQALRQTGLIGTDRRNGCAVPPGSGSALRGIRTVGSPVARHGGLQRLRRLHHRYRVLITADRLDVECPSLLHLPFLPHDSFDHPCKDIGSSILILGILEILSRFSQISLVRYAQDKTVSFKFDFPLKLRCTCL